MIYKYVSEKSSLFIAPNFYSEPDQGRYAMISPPIHRDDVNNLPESGKTVYSEYKTVSAGILYDTYCKYISDISRQIMAFIDDSISLKKTFETLSLLRYFDKPSEEIGLHAHKDWGWLTFLATDSSGFQVFQQNKLVSIDPIHGHLIVNAGNALAWLNPSYHSPLHRVRHSEEKYSIVYFLEPHPSVLFRRPLDFSNVSAELHGSMHLAFSERGEKYLN